MLDPLHHPGDAHLPAILPRHGDSPPDDDGELWDEYEARYLADATRVVVESLTENLPRRLTPSIYSATLEQVQALVDGLDTEVCLAWANEIAPDDVPSFETWARPERPE